MKKITELSGNEEFPGLKKLLKIMKLTTFLILFSVVCVFASETYSQTQKLNLNMKNATVKEVLSAIEDQSEFKFMYSAKVIDVDREVEIIEENSKIEDALKSLFAGTDVNFTIKDKIIVLSSTSLINNEQPSSQQQKSVSGKVTDSTGSSLPGVSIVVKGTTTGVITDMEGKYSLNVSAAGKVLTFSFVGMKTQEIEIGSKTAINVTLADESIGLDEVVAIGYGTTKRSSMVASTSTVSTKDIKNQPATRIDQVLQGRSSGIVVTNTSAEPNSTYSIRIRGSNSINGSNDPLVVIDGFIGGNLSSVNPNDISNIEILKDAASTAIYGSRGANGVIMVTTKSGSLNNIVVELNSFMTFGSVLKKLNLLSAGQYAEVVNENRQVFGQSFRFSDQEIANFYATGGTNWQDEVFTNSISQSHQVSVSGGTNKTKFYISGNYTDNQGIVKNTSFNNYAIRSNITTKLSEKFDVGLNLAVSSSMDHPATRSRDSNPVNASEQWAPTIAVYKADGSWTGPSSSYGQKAIYNPLALALEPIYDNKVTEISVNTFLDYNIISGLTAKFLVGARAFDTQNNSYINTKPTLGIGDAAASKSYYRNFLLQNTEQLNYTKTIADDHQIDITAVAEQQIEKYDGFSAGSSSYLSDAVTYNNLSLGSIVTYPSSTVTKKVIESFVGRINYSFKQKYLLSYTGRYDGSSVFGENSKWGYFPSAAIAWRINSENFMANMRQISNLKLRLSYGITGSQAVPAYSSLSQLNTTMLYSNEAGNGVATGVGFRSVANPDLRWEKTAQTNIGIDLGLFNERVQFTGDFYKKETTDLLFNVPLPLTSGYATVTKNVGSVSNTGFELNLSGTPLVGKFKWNTNLSFSVNRNKVLALNEGVTEVGFDRSQMTDLLPGMAKVIYLIVGEPMGVLKGYIQDGIWGTSEATEAASFGTIPGAPKYRDVNKDGKITALDIAPMGNTLPKFSYGWSNTFSYNNFDLNILVQGVKGNKIYNISRTRYEIDNNGQDATSAKVLNRWTPDNQNTDVPSIGGSKFEQLQSSRWIEDGSYLRVKTISLSYNLPKLLLNKVNIAAARISVTGNNLLTLTKFEGYDPESRSSSGLNSDTFGGVAIATYPGIKGYTFGLNVTF